MTSTEDHIIQFGFSSRQRNYRLLELPAPLIELLNGDDRPKLFLKSADVPLAGSNASSAANAVLCTPDQTYQLRQVHSSNTIFIVQPSLGADTVSDVPQGVAITASSKSTLELLPSSTDVGALLRQLLSWYTAPKDIDGDIDLPPLSSSNDERKMSKSDVLAALPVSVSEFEQAWKASCAFEDEQRIARQPTSAALLAIWESIVSASINASISLDNEFYKLNLWQVIDDEDYPEGLFDAVLTRLSSLDDFSLQQHGALDATVCVLWLGNLLLEANASAAEISLHDFIESWKDALPEVWRSKVSLNLLQGNFFHPTPSTIRSSKNGIGSSDQSASATRTTSKRSWHDRFKNPTKS